MHHMNCEEGLLVIVVISHTKTGWSKTKKVKTQAVLIDRMMIIINLNIIYYEVIFLQIYLCPERLRVNVVNV